MSELIKRFCLLTGILAGLFSAAGVSRAAEMDDYQRSFDAYRQSYSIYEVKRSDFVSSQTFASEEALLNAARDMLLLRSDSWSDYWKATSVFYRGVSSSTQPKKDEWNGFFETEINWLTAHKQALAGQRTRKSLSDEATLLNVKNQAYVSKAFEITIETIAGRMNDAIIQVRELNNTLLQKVKAQNIELIKQDLAIRGLEANLERLGQLEADLAIIRQDFINQAGSANNEQFATINQDFMPLHQQLLQITSNTREVSKDIQW
jgi:hypothetical protein